MLIRVFEIPPEDGQFCFGGKIVSWRQVDWFRDDGPPDGPEKHTKNQIQDYIQEKNYYSPDIPLLVLTEDYTFTLNYSAP